RGFREFRELRELRIRRHSIPPFIPLQGLAREFLPGKLREFLARLSQHLNAFVARREQLRLLQVFPKIPQNSSQNSPKIPPKIPKFCPKF
ncbi:CENPO protein, partial [Setophaga kirtlandii]|nr:CENPO protein [Setophaga kirtlandii]